MSAGDAGSADPTYVVAAELAEPVIALVLGVDRLVAAFQYDDEELGLAAIAELVAARNRVVELMMWQPGIPPIPIELGSWSPPGAPDDYEDAYRAALSGLTNEDRRRLLEGEWAPSPAQARFLDEPGVPMSHPGLRPPPPPDADPAGGEAGS